MALFLVALVAFLSPVIAIALPRNDTTSIAPGGTGTDSGVSRVVTVSIIVVLSMSRLLY
jgi:hypothetical protein